MFCLALIVFSILAGNLVSAQRPNLQCPLSNSTCQIQYVGYLARTRGPTGFAEYGIGRIEPQRLNKTSSKVFDIYEIKLIDGECYDIVNTCRLNYLEMDTENFRRIVKVNCGRIVIKFKYELSTNPYFCGIFGELSGCGNATIILEGWSFYINNPFKFYEKDGDIYLKEYCGSGIFKTNVEKASFDADIIRIDGRDITNKVLRFMNKYPKEILDVFGGDLMKLSSKYYCDVYDKFFAQMPATEIYTDDLSVYLNSEANNNYCSALADEYDVEEDEDNEDEEQDDK